MKFIALVIIVEALRLQKYLMLKKDTTLLIGIQKIFDLQICFPNVIIHISSSVSFYRSTRQVRIYNYAIPGFIRVCWPPE